MKYYIREIVIDEGIQKTAGVKARDDVEYILESKGIKPLNIPSQTMNRHETGVVSKVMDHVRIFEIWKKSLSQLKKGDQIIIQFPAVEHSIFLPRLVRSLTKKGVFVDLIIHDLELLRVAKRNDISRMKKIRLKLEEEKMLENSSRVIVHNRAMKEYVHSLGIRKEKLISLNIFDYLIPDFDSREHASDHACKNDPIIIAGNLRRHKAEYIYHLPNQTEFNLYGVGYEGEITDQIQYMGSFLPDELPFVLKGSFGLVWDGESSETCTGAYGEYLKINNPHKTSLYLASDIPVVIWKKAALAAYIEKNQCGITVNSLDEISERIRQMTDEEYAVLKANAKKVGKHLRNGYNLIKTGIL
ncbi:MAG: hypothetical protein ACI4D7_14510 [Lachnospiraceae bacterium]